MKDYKDYYEFIVVYANNLLFTSKDSKSVSKCLLEEFKFKLKGTVLIEYHQGCNFFRDSKNVLCLRLGSALKT